MKRLLDQLQNGGLSDTDYDQTVYQLMRDVYNAIYARQNRDAATG
jgi:hypothetical protein